jgi:hypothetical protein
MRDADQLAIETRGEAMHRLALHQPAPGTVVVGIGQHPLIEGVIADGERLPGLSVVLAKRRDLDHAAL